MSKKIAVLFAALVALAPSRVLAQATVLQGGAYAPGHAPMYSGQGSGGGQPIVIDSGAAGGGPVGVGLSELGITARGTGTPPYVAQGSGPLGTIDCRYDAPVTNATGYHYLCFSANSQGGGLIAAGAGGIAAPQPLCFIVNGTPLCIGGTTGTGAVTAALPTTTNAVTCWVNSSGKLGNCSAGAATLFGSPTGAGIPAPFTIQGLTARGPPDANNDKIPVYDSASGTIKYVTPGLIASSATAGVSSLCSLVGPLTATQNTACLNVFTSSLQGAVPASGGGTTNFLRSDGTFAAPPLTPPGGTSGQIQSNNSGAFGGFTASGDFTINTTTGVGTIGNAAVTNVKMAAGASGTVKSSTNGTTVTDNFISTFLNTACTITPSTCVTLFGYANPIWYGADPTNVSCSQTQINSAITASKLVQFSPGGTYNICGIVAVKAGVRINCSGSTLTQGNGVGLTTFVDFFTNTANNSEFDHCKIDGNYANNSTNLNTNFISIAGTGASQVKIHDNVLTGSSGGAVVIANSTYVTVQNNYIANCNAYGVALFNSAAGSRGYHQILNNTMIGPMLHMVQLDQVDGNIVSVNRLLQGTVLGGFTAMQVTVSGTAMSWVSGANFTGVTLGDVVVANGGTEYPITSVNSPTSLTVAANGNFTNGPAAIGGGDVLSITSTSFNNFTNNFISGGATGGIVLSNFGGNVPSTAASQSNVISGNYVENSGQFAIALESIVNSGAIVGETVITGNSILGPGRDSTAGSAGIGIQLSAAASTMTGIVIDGNFVFDPFAVTGGFWISGSGAANATNVAFGNNIQSGFVNGGNMSGYPTVASTPVIKGLSAYVIDANSCTTWGQTVTGGGSAFCQITYNGTNLTATGK